MWRLCVVLAGEGVVLEGEGAVLEGEVVVDLELGPDQIGIFPAFGEAPPRPSLDQAAHQLRIVAPTHKDLEFGIFGEGLQEDAIGECHLPQEVPIEVSFERRQEGFGTHLEITVGPLDAPALSQGLPQADHHLPQILLLLLGGVGDSTTFQISGLKGVAASGVDVSLDLRVYLDEI